MLEKYQVATSHYRQSAVIEQNGQMIKQQLDTIAMLEDQKNRAEAEVRELKDRKRRADRALQLVSSPTTRVCFCRSCVIKSMRALAVTSWV